MVKTCRLIISPENDQSVGLFCHRAKEYTHDLCLPPTLYQRLSPRVFGNSLDIIGKSTGQASDAQEPEYQAYGQCYPFLDAGRLRFKMERYDNSHADDGHVYTQSKP